MAGRRDSNFKDRLLAISCWHVLRACNQQHLEFLNQILIFVLFTTKMKKAQWLIYIWAFWHIVWLISLGINTSMTHLKSKNLLYTNLYSMKRTGMNYLFYVWIAAKWVNFTLGHPQRTSLYF